MGAFAAVRFSSRQKLPENRRPHSIARQNSPGADLADYCDIGIVSLKRTAWPSFNGTYGADGAINLWGRPRRRCCHDTWGACRRAIQYKIVHLGKERLSVEADSRSFLVRNRFILLGR
jgi:hypothetical protein